MKIQHIVRGASIIVHIPVGMALLSLPIAFVFNELEGAIGFLIAAAAALIVGQSGYWTFRNLGEDQRNLSDLMWIGRLELILFFTDCRKYKTCKTRIGDINYTHHISKK